MNQTAIPCVFMRGGTSKGLYFDAKDLHADRETRDRVLPAVMGSPDVRQIDGVASVSWANWFGGVYQDPANFFAQMVVEPEPFMKIYPEFKIAPEHIKAWLADHPPTS